MRRALAVGIVFLAACETREGAPQISDAFSSLLRTVDGRCQAGLICDVDSYSTGYFCNSSCALNSCDGSVAPTHVWCEPTPTTTLSYETCDSMPDGSPACVGTWMPFGTNGASPDCSKTMSRSSKPVNVCGIGIDQLSLEVTEVSVPRSINGEVHLNEIPPIDALVVLCFSQGGVCMDPPPTGVSLPSSTVTVDKDSPTTPQSVSFGVNVDISFATDQAFEIMATLQDNPRSNPVVPLTFRAPPAVINVTMPDTVTAGQPIQGTVTLGSPASGGGAILSIASDKDQVVPSVQNEVAGCADCPFTLATLEDGSPSQVVTLTFSTAAGGVQRQVNVVRGSPIVPGCNQSRMVPARNDDGSSGPVALVRPNPQPPFVFNFYGTTYDSVYVNNNGNVTFGEPQTDYTPYAMDADVYPPMIAPFFADVDTRGMYSQPVEWGIVQYGDPPANRPALCVNWVDVGYYFGKSNLLNSFQLLLVDRDNRHVGDFDIIMNYDHINWESGDRVSPNKNGLGGISAAVGYSAGVGDPARTNTYYQLPGSMQSGSFLDANLASGLANKTNSTKLGRYAFQVVGTATDEGAVIEGWVTGSNGAVAKGAPVQVCPTSGTEQCVAVTRTDDAGYYQARGIPGALGGRTYYVTAMPPASSWDQEERYGPVTIYGKEKVSPVNLALGLPIGIPPGTTLSPSSTAPNTVPRVNWGNDLYLQTKGCPGGTATYRVELAKNEGNPIAQGVMTENLAPHRGTYYVTIPHFWPNHDDAMISIEIICKGGSIQLTTFNIYIDPSGVVRTTSGLPVRNAQVTLFHSSTGLEFNVVPSGSEIMSPSNRANPDLTDGQGRFGWDVISGFYKVRAAAPGCTSPDGGTYVETPVLTIPPAVIDLDLRLSCPALEDSTPPVSTATVSPAPNAEGWNQGDTAVSIHATDDRSGVKEIVYSLSGAQSGGATAAGDTVTVPITAEGATTVTYFARDRAGNQETPKTLEIRIDRTPPVLTCSASPGILFPPNHKLVPVHVAVQLADTMSGPVSYVLSSATSNEPDNGSDDGNTDGDIQEWSIGTADVDGWLRAERSGIGSGRTYTLVYTAQDLAGNTSTCSASVNVPLHN